MASVDVERLFKQFTVVEVKDIEKKVKADIERKKEDLRQMVGRRYRDIIEAADNIKEMKNSSEEILTSVRRVQKSLVQLESLQHQLSSVQQKSKFRTTTNLELTFSNKNACKFLADLTELIWQSLDESKSLEAAYFYALADRVYRLINTQAEISLFKEFVEQIWIRLQSRRPEILECASLVVGDFDTEDSEQIDALCSLLLVDSLKINDVFVRFLNIRKETLRNLIDNSSDVSARETISTCLNLLQNTVISGWRIFLGSSPADDSRLLERLKLLQTGRFESGIFSTYLKFQNRSFVACLPNDLKNFHCCSDHGKLDENVLRNEMTDWLSNCLNLCRERIDQLLPYFENVDSLTSLKSSSLQVLCKYANDSEWKFACEALFGNEVSLWFGLLATSLQNRLKDLVCGSVVGNFDQLFHEIDKIASIDPKNASFNFATFLWRQLASDNLVLTEDNTKKPTYTVPLKANGISVDLYEPCFVFDKKFGSLKESVEKFFDLTEYLEMRRCFEIQSDAVWQSLSNVTSESVEKFIDYVNNKVSVPTDSNESTWKEHQAFRAVQCSKLCRCMTELLPNLKSVILWQQELSIDSRTRKSQSPDVWFEAKTKLNNCAICLLNVWSNFVVENAFSSSIPVNAQQLDYTFWLLNAQEWDTVEIEEEAEDGRKVMSKMLVPSVCSKYVHNYLHTVCKALCSIGSHVFPRECVFLLNRLSFEKMLQFYHSILLSVNRRDDDVAVIRQKQALQMMFDLKFLNGYLNCSKQSGGIVENTQTVPIDKQVESILKSLESFVDPFDLDVMNPYVKRNVAKQMQKCQCLYGVLLTPDTIFTHFRTGQSGGGISQKTSVPGSSAVEQPQILSLSQGSSGRFHLLPVQAESKLSISSGLKTATTAVRKNVQHVSSAVDRAATSSGGLQTSGSASSFTTFYDKLSSGWFGM